MIVKFHRRKAGGQVVAGHAPVCARSCAHHLPSAAGGPMRSSDPAAGGHGRAAPPSRAARAKSGGLVFPVGKIDQRAADSGGPAAGSRGPAAAWRSRSGKIGWRASGRLWRLMAARPGSCQVRRPKARQARRLQARPVLTRRVFDPVDPPQVDPAHGKTRRIRPGLVVSPVAWNDQSRYAGRSQSGLAGASVKIGSAGKAYTSMLSATFTS